MVLMRRGLAKPAGMLSEDPAVRRRVHLAALDDLVFAGWDPRGEDELTAARRNAVLEESDLAPVAKILRAIQPWPARWSVAAAKKDIGAFRRKHRVSRVVVVNVMSTEPVGKRGASAIYARAAIETGCPFINFTPNVADELPALRKLAEQGGVPLAGKDGKTGQTMMKSVLAPAFRSRGLHVDGWFSTNLLGNEDGRTLKDPAAHRAKQKCKSDLLEQMLGYEVPAHVVQIHYYPPRGDNKEAWDNIDLTGFLGKRMAVKVNFLCRDSILAAPLVVDLVRFMDLAARRGERGPQEWLSFYFKAPYACRQPIDHGLAEQHRALLAYLQQAEQG